MVHSLCFQAEDRKKTAELNSSKLAAVFICSCIRLRECTFGLFSSFPNIWTAKLLKHLLFFPSFCRLGMDIYIYSGFSSSIFMPTPFLASEWGFCNFLLAFTQPPYTQKQMCSIHFQTILVFMDPPNFKFDILKKVKN